MKRFEPFSPKPEDRLKILLHIRFEIESLFLEPNCGGANLNDDLRESILFRRMGHCRVLRDFFTTKARKPRNDYVDDAVLASDFGFPQIERSILFETLKNAERVNECFNKRLFHLTYSRLSLSDQTWCIETAFPCVKNKAMEFVAHVLAKAASELDIITPEESGEWEKLQRKLQALPRATLQTNTMNIPKPDTFIVNLLMP